MSIPRDRDGTFIPRLVPKGARRVGGLDDIIVSLYAGGMTVTDIEHHLATTICTEIPRETISKITDSMLEGCVNASGAWLTVVYEDHLYIAEWRREVMRELISTDFVVQMGQQ